MRVRACALMLGTLVAGCGGGGGTKPPPISGPAKQAADVVERLGKATAARDYATICDRLFATSTRRASGGSDCASVLEQRARGVNRPRIRIVAIEVQGNHARVHVRTTAAGQAPVADVIQLVRQGGGFRVLSLGR